MKQHIATKQTIETIKAGARLMLVKIDKSEECFDLEITGDGSMISWRENTKDSFGMCNDSIESFIEQFIPIQQGDEIYIAEEFVLSNHGTPVYKSDCKDQNGYHWSSIAEDREDVFWTLPSEMTEQQSRFKFKVWEVSVERVQDISKLEMYRMLHSDKGIYLIRDIVSDFIDWLEDQGINYNDNQYVALVELKDIK